MHEVIRPDRTVTYGSPDGHDLEMHFFFPPDSKVESPADRAPRPSILFIHGGGFQNGQPSQFFWHAREAAAKGFIACSISYRLSDVASFPAALVDSRAALGYLESNSSDLGIDPTKIAVAGSSAGGYLAIFLGATSTRISEDEPEHILQAACVIDIHGVSNLADTPHTDFRAAFMGVAYADDPEAYRNASPIQYVDSSSSPMLIFHDPKDEVVSFDQSLHLAEALDSAGVGYKLIRLSGTKHGYVYNRENLPARETIAESIEWLNKRFLR